MERREFMSLLGLGTLSALLIPSVAKALESGDLSAEALYEQAKDPESPVWLTQQGKVVARMKPSSMYRSPEKGLDLTRDNLTMKEVITNGGWYGYPYDVVPNGEVVTTRIAVQGTPEFQAETVAWFEEADVPVTGRFEWPYSRAPGDSVEISRARAVIPDPRNRMV